MELYEAAPLAVFEEGPSHRDAARQFGIDHRTVKKVLSYSALPRNRQTKPVTRFATIATGPDGAGWCRAPLRHLRNGPGSGDPDRVRTFIRQLRRRLGDDAGWPAWILNEHGVGYRVPKPED